MSKNQSPWRFPAIPPHDDEPSDGEKAIAFILSWAALMAFCYGVAYLMT